MRTRLLLLALSVFISQFALAKDFVFSETPNDFKIPAELWKKIDETAGKDTLTYVPIKVKLVEKNPDVLVDSEVNYQFPKGGGEIDLSQVIKDQQQGTFRVSFDLSGFENSENVQVFYVSKARKRRLQDELWGVGCNKYMDVTSFVKKKMTKDGLEVNTTKLRHLTVLGGHFIFVLKNQITQVTFTDSTHPDYFCPEEKVIPRPVEIKE
jgi:hypothetical protein